MRILPILALALCLNACTSQGDKGDDNTQQVVDTIQQGQEEPVQEDTTSTYQFPALEGKAWSLTSYVIDNETRTLLDTSVINMTLKNGKASGSSGCNSYNATVLIQSDGAINFSQIASTRKLCQGLMTQEKQYLELLESAQSYSVNKVFLEIECRNGKLSYRTPFAEED
jgi:heat shock protein HslJ